jgi:hypothetical protein
MGQAKKPRREWRTNNGVQEVKCASCHAFKPATREFFFFQGKGGCRGPHSWCKPCYASNLGRGPGMRTRIAEVAPVPEVVAYAQREFVALPIVGAVCIVGALV